jgi:dethiobiotin synthetase
MSRIIFITGTDTGVGKTLLSGLLLQHLRRSGCHALAMKPFASGSRADAIFLRAVQEKELTIEQVNPFYFSEPVAPLVASRSERCWVPLSEAVRGIKSVARRCECLLVEGVGGILVPLGEGYCVLDLIAELGCPAVVVSRNKLGTINHTLLTCAAMQHAGIKLLTIVLMAPAKADHSTISNRQMLSELLAPTPVLAVPFLGRGAMSFGVVEGGEKKLKKTLAQILA